MNVKYNFFALGVVSLVLIVQQMVMIWALPLFTDPNLTIIYIVLTFMLMLVLIVCIFLSVLSLSHANEQQQVHLPRQPSSQQSDRPQKVNNKNKKHRHTGGNTPASSNGPHKVPADVAQVMRENPLSQG